MDRGAVLRACAGVVTGLALLMGCSAPAVPDLPPIEEPRDLRGVDPCTVLDAPALTAAGVGGPGSAGTGAEGQRCEWTGDGNRSLVVTLFTGDGGLATLARNSEPTTTRVRLDGYPALETFTGSGEFCQYDIGISADQVLLVALDGGVPDSCTALQAMLPPVLSRLPG